jgi:uncharacterized membrane protein SpoIIM required for sporulation
VKEVAFINANREKWENIAVSLANIDELHPDVLAGFYVEVTGDLSFCKTFFPHSETSIYLNHLAVKIHRQIYRSHKGRKRVVADLFKTKIPLLFYKYRRYIAISLAVFVLSGVIGYLSFQEDENVVYSVLGQDYVNMTSRNIDKGDPMGVYGMANEEFMFIAITLNNVFVSFLVFLFGIFTPLGTVWQLMKNGVMVGVFQSYFYSHHLLTTSTMAIMIHGTLELSAIVLAGAAGIAFGRNIFFPGSHTRLHSFRIAMRDGTIMLLGLVPVFVAAGFIESYITRYYNQMSLVMNLAIIAVSLSFIIGYFIIYPKILYHKLTKQS